MRRPSLRRRIEAAWYGDPPGAAWLAPLAALYAGAMALRRRAYAAGVLRTERLPVPVIVVGNLATGGTGKTPVVGWVVDRARSRGFRPGIVARGYGGRVGAGPRRVQPGDPAALVGDEPLLHARGTGVPVAVGADRPAAARLLLEAGCDLVVADDGLQHLALGRDRELVVVDGERGAGNGRVLPAGPLREPWARLATSDLVLVNGGGAREPAWPPGVTPARFDLVADAAAPFGGGPPVPLAQFAGQDVRALAGIGNPARFHRLLADHGLRVVPVPVDDHGRAAPADLAGNAPLLMTAKDAVKYGPADRPAGAGWWVVPVTFRASAEAEAGLDRLLAGLRPGAAHQGPAGPER
jgi:tetraacyldisaccharide 4'-kinase